MGIKIDKKITGYNVVKPEDKAPVFTIAPEEADRLMAIINELTTDEAPETGEEAVATTAEDVEASSEMEAEGGATTTPDTSSESGTVGGGGKAE